MALAIQTQIPYDSLNQNFKSQNSTLLASTAATFAANTRHTLNNMNEHQLTDKLDKLYLETREEYAPNPYRISGCGKCTRTLGYQHVQWPGIPLTPRAIRTFSLGQAIHDEIQGLLVAHGHASRLEEEVSISIPLLEEYEGKDTLLTGHIDGIYNAEDGDRVLEIKSSTEMGFYMFYRADKMGHMQANIDETYQCQNVAYKKALSLPGTWLYYNKNTSALLAFDADDSTDAFYFYRIRQKYTALRRFIESGVEKPPESLREFGPEKEKKYKKETGRLKLKWNCTYCAYVEDCWPNTSLEFVSGKPVHYIV